jgi:flagellin
MSNISLTFNEMKEGSAVTASSYVSAKARSLTDRTITINQSDLSPGNVVSVNIGSKEYAVKVNSGDLAADVAYRLASLIDDDYPPVTGTVTNSTATFASVSNFTVATGVFSAAGSATATFATGMAAGDSITIAGLTFTARRAITTQELAAAWSGLSALATTGNGASYGDYSGSLIANITTAAATSTTVTFTAAAAIANNGLGLINDQGQAVTRAVSSGTTRSSNVITIGAGSNLGLEDISVSVKKITDPGKITITANADTGIGGTKQSIDVGTIAAGSAKSFDFDNLGVSFTLNNTRATAVNAASFEALTPKANTLAVQSAMNGEALFQVGAGTRDNVVLDGFKDIRITGQNKNAGSEKEVFDKINETLTTIAANTTESLSTANFATLENRIEDAITMVSDFRSYFGGQQNRIEFAISNIQAQSENLTAANSRIVDTDYAAETANLTKTQIMQQAATAMLAQANQMPNVILALLK